jgi:hypothetical protein
MRHRTIVLAICLYLAVAGLGVAFHWYAATHAESLKEWYLQRNPTNDKPINAALVDLVFPAIILGFGVGCLTARSPQWEAGLFSLILSIGVVALFPVYAMLIPTKEYETWLQFAPFGRGVLVLLPVYFKAALICLFFAGVGRSFARSVKKLKPDL